MWTEFNIQYSLRILIRAYQKIIKHPVLLSPTNKHRRKNRSNIQTFNICCPLATNYTQIWTASLSRFAENLLFIFIATFCCCFGRAELAPARQRLRFPSGRASRADLRPHPTTVFSAAKLLPMAQSVSLDALRFSVELHQQYLPNRPINPGVWAAAACSMYLPERQYAPDGHDTPWTKWARGGWRRTTKGGYAALRLNAMTTF